MDLPRLYLDTSTLIAAGWPRMLQLEPLTELARRLNVPMSVPAPVLLELPSHWHRTWEKGVGALRDAERNLRVVAEGWKSPDGPTWEEVAAELQARSDAALRDQGMYIAPFPRASIEDLFQAAVNRSILFGENDQHFRDSVILLAIRDDLATHPDSEGLLVAQDKDFDPERCAVVAPGLRVVASIHDAIERLKAANITLLREWERTNALLRDALERERGRLTSFLYEQVSRDATLLGLTEQPLSLFVQPISPDSVFTPITTKLKVPGRNAFECYLLMTLRYADYPMAAALRELGLSRQPLVLRSAVLEGSAYFDGTSCSDLELLRIRRNSNPPNTDQPGVDTTRAS